MRNRTLARTRITNVIQRMGLFIAAFIALSAHAQTITIFDDALQNGFDGPNYSYGSPSPIFNSSAQAHSGTKSIAFTGTSFNAVCFHYPDGSGNLSTATYPVLRFWVHGGSGSGQKLRLFVANDNVYNPASGVVLDSYITGGAVAAGVWREVIVNLTQAPFNAVSFDRIDIQSDQSAAQPTLYIDDMTVGQATAVTVSPMQIDHDVVVHTITSDRFTWRDSAGQPRVASLAHNDAETEGGSHGGALREYKFQLSNGQTRTATVTTYPNAGFGGFGYVTLHSSRYIGCNGDDSPLGMGFSGHWQRVFEGRHHAIFRFTQLYPRNCPTTGPVITRYLPVTIDWVFSTGHDNPLWAVTYDVDQIAATGGQPVAANTYYDDSRAPYGELNIDGDGFTYDINGTSWGDRYKFIPGNAPGTPMTLNVPWTWNTQNTVPFVKEWIDAALGGAPYKGDATMGIVLTQPMTQQDAGGARDPGIGSDITPYWTKTDADNIHSAGAFKVPDGNNWPFQANGNNLSDAAGSNNARLTWKTQFGFIGQSAYGLNDGSGLTAPGYPKKSYSTYVVLGQHSTLPVDAQVAQVETVQSLTLTASVGSVVTSGPAGITRSDNVTYTPAGYNHVYGALAFQASGNALDANVRVSPVTEIGVTSPGSYYAFDGIAGQNPPLTLVQGVTYHFNINTAANHPFEILDAPPGSVTNNNISSGTITFAVPNGGGAFRYHCSVHDFGNTIATTGAGAGTLKKPLLILSNYTGSDPTVKLGGTTLVADADYFASLRPAVSELWITFNRDLSGTTNHIEISGGGLATPSNVVASATSTSQITISWSAVAGAAAYEIQRSTNYGSVNNGFTTLTTVSAPTATFNNTSLSPNTTYLYKVRAINGATMSPFSAIDPATTIVFTDDPLNTGVTAKAVHVTQLRTAVNAMRAAAGLGAQSFTDPGLASGGIIKAAHQNELRAALNEARSTIGLAAISYADSPTVTAASTKVKAAHVVNLRDGVK